MTITNNPPQQYTPHDGGPRPVPDDTWIIPRYRAAEDAKKGIRRAAGYAGVFAWHHDGEDSDILGYVVEARP